jgi:hypothetical protein
MVANSNNKMGVIVSCNISKGWFFLGGGVAKEWVARIGTELSVCTSGAHPRHNAQAAWLGLGEEEDIYAL